MERSILRHLPCLLCSTCVIFILSFFILYPHYPFKVTTIQDHHSPVQTHIKDDGENCDLFKGHWVPDSNGSLYTNWSCATVPNTKNCFKYGRNDTGFVNWRWKPDGCELPRIDPKAFLGLVRGKTIGFIGDSVARNHMESLLCLLSQEEVPVDIYKDSEDRTRTWHFPKHNFTLKVVWTKFLVAAEERLINGSSSGIYDLHLDKVDTKWTQALPGLDYAIISSAHWFFRTLYLYDHANLTGCYYCTHLNPKDPGVSYTPNLTDLGINHAVKMAYRTAFEYINNCKECKGMTTLLRTFAPAHFEDGGWNNGGTCQRTRPYGEGEIELSGYQIEMRKVQVEELERARKRGEKRGNKFGLLDVTGAMMMRPDGHPSTYWEHDWDKHAIDCVHWCLPGPIDAWSDLLMALLRNQ